MKLVFSTPPVDAHPIEKRDEEIIREKQKQMEELKKEEVNFNLKQEESMKEGPPFMVLKKPPMSFAAANCCESCNRLELTVFSIDHEHNDEETYIGKIRHPCVVNYYC